MISKWIEIDCEDIVTYIHFQTDETACQEGPWLCRKCMLQNSSSLDKASRSVTTNNMVRNQR